jgi:hypothetical protein
MVGKQIRRSTYLRNTSKIKKKKRQQNFGTFQRLESEAEEETQVLLIHSTIIC